MIEFTCDNCGSVFKVKESFAGKTAECMCCKQKIIIPHPVSLEADGGELELYDISAEDDLPLEAKTTLQDNNNQQHPPILDLYQTTEEESPKSYCNTDTLRPNHFWSQLPGCLFFVINWPNILSTICIILLGLPFSLLMSFYPAKLRSNLPRFFRRRLTAFIAIGVIAFICLIYLLGYVLRLTCQGNNKMVSMIRIHDNFDGFDEILTVIKSILWAAIPSVPILILMLICRNTFQITPWLKNTSLIIASGLFLFFWPISLLVMQMYEVEISAVRHDIMLKKVLRTLPQYIMTCTIVSLCIAGIVVCSMRPGAIFVDYFDPSSLSVSTQWANRLLFLVALLYLSITAMRVIGVYYRTCKEKLDF